MDRANNEIGIEIGRTARDWREVVVRARAELEADGRAQILPIERWAKNPKDDKTDQRIPNGDPRLNWPAAWPEDGAPFPGSDYSPDEGNYEDRDKPIEWIDPQTAIDRGLIDPKTLLPRIRVDESKPIRVDVNTRFRTATASPRRDPLAIDLDGDGIETIGIPTDGTLPVLFDHDADGVKAGTGWLKPDDGWLVRDINGNGIIDSGRELFGADTQITKFWSSTVNEISTTFSYTENALTGFEALRALDTGPGNGSPVAYGSPGAYDGLIDSRNAAFSELRIWRDLNSDGVSQEGELQTLAQAGIESIGVTPNDTNTNLGNGNTVTGTATVTRTSGTQEQIGSVDLTAGNLNLGSNPFYRTFTDSIPLTDTARALPEMGGSGWLRDLREALSLGTPASAELVDVVQQFAAATTRDAQMALLDKVLSKWAGTTGKLDTRYADFLAAGGISAIAHETLEFSTVAETDTANTFCLVGAGPDYWPDVHEVVYTQSTFNRLYS
jgi:hypothetical protein